MIEQPPLLERRVGHDRDISVKAPGHQIVLDAAQCEIIENLVGRNLCAAVKSPKLDHVHHVEITDAPITNFAGIDESGKGVHRFLQWYVAAPVKQIEIEAICPEAPQAMLARSDCPGFGRIFGEDLADKE